MILIVMIIIYLIFLILKINDTNNVATNITLLCSDVCMLLFPCYKCIAATQRTTLCCYQAVFPSGIDLRCSLLYSHLGNVLRTYRG